VQVSFAAVNLDTSGTDPRYGIEVYFNGVQVQQQLVIRTNQLLTNITAAPFTLQSVGAKTGLGPDNILSLRGINFGGDGGGNWMGIDYVQLNPVAAATNAPPKFTLTKVSNGSVNLTWTGTGALEAATNVLGPWTPISPAPSSPYSELTGTNRYKFFRLRAP